MFKKSACILLMITIGILFLLPLSGLLLHHGLYTIPHFLHSHAVWLTLWRYSLYLFVMLFWSTAMDWIGRQRHWSPDLIYQLKGLHWQVMGLFIFIEVFFVHNLMGYLFSLL